MKIIIDAEPKELAALVLVLQERQSCKVDEIMDAIASKMDDALSGILSKP